MQGQGKENVHTQAVCRLPRSLLLLSGLRPAGWLRVRRPGFQQVLLGHGQEVRLSHRLVVQVASEHFAPSAAAVVLVTQPVGVELRERLPVVVVPGRKLVKEGTPRITVVWTREDWVGAGEEGVATEYRAGGSGVGVVLG